MFLHDVSLSYDDKVILNNINLEFEKGKYYTIIGKNGSGKSSLAKVICTLIKPDCGSVNFNCAIGMVFQNPDDQFVREYVLDELAFGMENLNFSTQRMWQNIYLYAKLLGIYELLERKISTLSGGQKQRVCICAILCMETDVVILDEFCSMVDPATKYELLKLIAQLNKILNLTVISITHYLNECLQADEVILLEQGCVSKKGHHLEVFSANIHELMKPKMYDICDKLDIIANFNSVKDVAKYVNTL